MVDVQIPDNLYMQASQAAQAQSVSVDDLVAEAVQQYLQDDVGLEARFTPKVVSHLDRIAEDLDERKHRYSSEQVDESIKANRTEWLADHRS